MAQDSLVRLIGPTALVSGTTTIFTGVSGHTYTIRDITILNTSGASVSISLGIGGVAAGNLILPTSTIVAGGFATYSGVLILENTETLQANTSNTGLTILANGMDQEI